MIEGVQRKATRMILGYGEKSYEERLKLCKLLTLEQRRHRGDMIEVFKLLNGFDDVKFNNFINAWNNLPASIVECHSVNSFKHYISVYLSVNSGL
jgi:hypothetical protein